MGQSEQSCPAQPTTRITTPSGRRASRPARTCRAPTALRAGRASSAASASSTASGRPPPPVAAPVSPASRGWQRAPDLADEVLALRIGVARLPPVCQRCSASRRTRARWTATRPGQSPPLRRPRSLSRSPRATRRTLAVRRAAATRTAHGAPSPRLASVRIKSGRMAPANGARLTACAWLGVGSAR